MSSVKPTVLVAGAGNIAQYLLEEFQIDGNYEFAVLARSDNEWFHEKGATFHQIKKYSTENILKAIDSANTIALISTIQTDDPAAHMDVHEAMLSACRQSRTCKRFIPSEHLGNVRDFPSVPVGMTEARHAFRESITKVTDIQWTFVCQGWLADYFIQTPDGSKSYIRPFPQGWPIDLEKRTVRLVGSGENLASWTAARDVARAIVKLIPHDDWPAYTWIFGEHGTWNEAIRKLERFHGFTLQKIPKSDEEIDRELSDESNRSQWYTATMDDWSRKEAASVPKDEALALRQKYFKDLHFSTLEDILTESQKKEFSKL